MSSKPGRRETAAIGKACLIVSIPSRSHPLTRIQIRIFLAFLLSTSSRNVQTLFFLSFSFSFSFPLFSFSFLFWCCLYFVLYHTTVFLSTSSLLLDKEFLLHHHFPFLIYFPFCTFSQLQVFFACLHFQMPITEFSDSFPVFAVSPIYPSPLNYSG